MTYKYNNIFILDLKKLIIVTCTSSILFVYIMSYICLTFIICLKMNTIILFKQNCFIIIKHLYMIYVLFK